MKSKFLNYLALTTIVFSGWTAINQRLVQASIIHTASKSYISTSTSGQTRAKELLPKIADLEVRRVLLTSRYTLDSSEIKSTNLKLQNLRQELLQLQPNSSIAMNKAIAGAIKTRIAELEVERAIKGAALILESPVIQMLEEDIQNLRKRFTQIQPRNSRTVINRTASKSIKSKISELKAEQARLKTIYSRDSVNLVVINEKILQLKKRLAMLK
jgi:hypothetical protein